MNTRLLTFSLIALLGLGSMETAGVNAGSLQDLSLAQQKKLLEQQHQALVQEELTLAQTYRQLMDQKRALLEQLRALNPKGTTQDWETLWENYHQYEVSDSEMDKDIYKDKLKSLNTKDVDKDAFKSQVKALLKALEAVQQQQDALTLSWVAHNQKKQQINNDKKSYTQKIGKN